MPTTLPPCTKPSANVYDFVPRYITQKVGIGATFSLAFNAKVAGIPLDLAPYTVTAPILPREGIAPPVAAFAVAKIAVPPPPDPTSIQSQVIISLTANDTQALGAAVTLRPVVWEWCIWLTDPLTIESILFERGAIVLAYPLQPMVIAPAVP